MWETLENCRIAKSSVLASFRLHFHVRGANREHIKLDNFVQMLLHWSLILCYKKYRLDARNQPTPSMIHLLLPNHLALMQSYLICPPKYPPAQQSSGNEEDDADHCKTAAVYQF